MRKHEYFEELSALARIGQLSSAEHLELVQHLKSCDACRRADDDFASILDQLPLLDSDVSTDSLEQLQTASYRSRFLDKARSAGVGFTSQALTLKAPRTRRSPWVYALAPAAAAALGVAVLLIDPGVLRSLAAHGPVVHSPAVHGEDASVQHVQPLAQAPKVVSADVVPAAVPAASGPDPALATLQAEHDATQREIQSLKDELAQTTRAKETSAGQAEHQTQVVAQLQTRIRDYEQSQAQTSAEMERLRSEKDQVTAALVADEVRMRELADEVRVREAAADRERQLTAAAGDVREMMGARYLHIIDVFDADGRGRSRKSFGRVFYVEGKSLIFYAFDLAQKGAGNTKVSFQAWGQRESAKDSAKNLGVFFVDDHLQSRWVLKVNDPDKLRAIDSVFVTVERFGGADRPTGQKLLYAYLGSQANHP